MQVTSDLWIGSELSDADFADLAHRIISRDDVGLLPSLWAVAERHADLWDTEQGQLILIRVLQLLLDAFEARQVAMVLSAMQACPPRIAGVAHDLLLLSFRPDGQLGDPGELGDSVLLTLALLLGTSGRHEAVGPFLDQVKTGRAESFFLPPANQIAAHFAPAQPEKFKPKLIVWDLDDTLWQGTLADGDEPVLDVRRAGYVRRFNRHGIVSAICSKNDHAAARAKLEAFGLWDAFVFPRIAFVPKGAVIKRMIADMQLRAANVLFVDDNPHNLHEVAQAVPGISTLDARSPECDALLEQLLKDHAHIAKSRVEDYRLLETRVAEREDHALSDEAFLLQSGIHATFTDRMDNLEFADRIEELINRSNQLNYTQSRIEPGTIRQRIQDIDHYEVLCAFVWDKYGYYGLVGVAVYAFRTRTLEHFAFSCRIMHMGVEDAMIGVLAERGYKLDGAQFRKPLPPQSARAIRIVSYSDPEVRERILAQEAPRDWSKVQLRIMADCQSGAFFHYSRFQDETDYDNNPRLFSLPQMATGEYAKQQFPRHLVYTAATDYIDWRWVKLCPMVDVDIFRDCADRFVELVRGGDRKCLVFLPPQGLALEMYELHMGCVPSRSRDLHPVLNEYWRDVARRHPEHFTLIELAEMLAPEELVHAHHYVPSALKRIAGMIDDWHAAQKGA